MSSASATGLSCVGCRRVAGPEVDVDEALPVPLLPGARFRRREVTVAVGSSLDFVDADWRGALVLVEQGEIDLYCSRGGRRRFSTGAVLFFDGLGLVALRNPGLVDAVLVALMRRT
jgi:hypothetical protein